MQVFPTFYMKKVMATKQGQQIRFATSLDGTRIAYACAGAGPILVRSGRWIGHLELDRNSAVRRPFHDEMCRTYAYCMHDTGGTGLSDRDVTDVSLEAQVRDLEAVVGAAGFDRFSLPGISGAGTIAVAYDARHPQRVTRLALQETTSRGIMKRNPTPQQIAETQLLVKLIEVG